MKMRMPDTPSPADAAQAVADPPARSSRPRRAWRTIEARNSTPVSVSIALAATSMFIKQVLQEYGAS